MSGELRGRAHLLPVRIYYEDTDFTGFVYHANYLRYLERGRSDFLRTAGVDHTALLAGDDPVGFAIQRMTLEFLRPARIDDALTIRTTFDEVRGARLFIAQEAVRDGQTLLRAQVEACCIGVRDGRPKRPPKALVERLRPLLDAGRS